MKSHIAAIVSRRQTLIRAGAVAVLGFAGLRGADAQAHDLKPNDPDYRFDEYESIVNRDLDFRLVFEWSNLYNNLLPSNLNNGLNAIQFSYAIAPEKSQVVVQAYASANYAMYDDYIWQKYSLGAALNIKDPKSGEPAVRNPWYASSISVDELGQALSDRHHPYYADSSFQGAQRRGTLFLI
jgi:hypothetical protein